MAHEVTEDASKKGAGDTSLQWFFVDRGVQITVYLI